MKAVVIDTFNYYNIRTKYIYDVLSQSGFETIILSSNFNHMLKQKVCETRDNTVFIETKEYKKNLSVKRIVSHLDFSKKAYNVICKNKPDLIYCLVPLNSLVKKVAKYAKRNRCKVYFDVFDLWPESLPTNGLIKKLLFSWKNLRNKHIGCAEKVFLECDYYRQFLPQNDNYFTAYLSKPQRKITYCQNNNTLDFVYLGSINNIIDIDGIIKFLCAINQKKKVKLHIIGKGEKIELLKESLGLANVDYEDYGAKYDEDQKDQIISKCHFGINMYKEGLCIGLTMKSLDYFSRGLPIINANIYDTTKIIDECNCGFNISNNLDDIVNTLSAIDDQQWQELSSNCINAYNNYFSIDKFCNIIGEALDL